MVGDVPVDTGAVDAGPLDRAVDPDDKNRVFDRVYLDRASLHLATGAGRGAVGQGIVAIALHTRPRAARTTR